MTRLVRQWARKSKTAIVLYKIYENWRLRKQFLAGEIETGYGSTHTSKTLAESLAYIDNQFEDYLASAKLDLTELRGKKILELGCGDNFGVALRFLAAGAANVVCLDKFYSKNDPAQQKAIYKALRDELSNEQRARVDAAIILDNSIEIDGTRLRYVCGSTLDKASADLARDYHSFDLIVSCAVLEEIYDPEATFLAMDKLLAPGGYLLHKIDLGDYGLFRDQGMNPLTFLTIPEAVYRWMASDSALPNRRRLSYYRETTKRLGYETKLLATSVIPDGPLRPYSEMAGTFVDASDKALAVMKQVRPNLDQQFRDLPDQDLIVDGIFLVARKPMENGTLKG